MQNIPSSPPCPPSDPPTTEEVRSKHLGITEPSPWVARFASLVPNSGAVLDLAAGGGRHGRYFLERGHRVVFIDKDTSALGDLARSNNATVIEANLESPPPPFDISGPLHGMTFDAIVIVNYLHRPLFDKLIRALTPGGVLIYETFARGNEDFARPRNPEHLLKSGELLQAVRSTLQVVAFEHGRIDVTDIPGIKQRICAIKDLGLSQRDDGDPPAHKLS